jgi:hypothetical protein
MKRRNVLKTYKNLYKGTNFRLQQRTEEAAIAKRG